MNKPIRIAFFAVCIGPIVIRARPHRMTRGVEFLMMIILIILLACTVVAARGVYAIYGGYGGSPRTRTHMRTRPQPGRPRHLVVDGLNLIHWLHARARGPHSPRARAVDLGPAAVTAAIAETAPLFRKALRDPYGLLIYVIKDRDGTLNDSAVRAAYQAAAEKYRVEITSVEQDTEGIAALCGTAAARSHAARGRDDFYTCLLAQRYRCPVASEDRLRDFEEFRAQVPPFRTVSFTRASALPANDYIRPSDSAYRRLKRPRMLRFEQLLGGLS